MAEGELTIGTLHRRLSNKKELGMKLISDLEQIRNEMVSMQRNTEMQIVIARGWVELPLSGKLKDFDDAVLICRKEVEDINKIILVIIKQ